MTLLKDEEKNRWFFMTIFFSRWLITMTDENQTSSSAQSVEFILLLIVEIPSMCCTLLILIYFVLHCRTMITKALRNHVILLLTIMSFLYISFDLPFTINSYRLNFDQPRTKSFCLWWYWLDYVLVVGSLLLAATASVQRHVLIFNFQFFHRKSLRIVFHYCPLIICILYPPIFYFVLIYFYPCEYSLVDDDQHCIYPCYLDNTILFNIDWLVNTLIPVFVIVLANLVLITRVVRSLRKFRRRKILILKRQRKLLIELLLISSLYAIGWGPSTVVSVIEQFFLPNLTSNIPELNYLDYISYFVCPLQPFTCLIISPELITWFRKFFKRSIIHPEIFIQNIH